MKQVLHTWSGVECRALVHDQRILDCKLHNGSALAACKQVLKLQQGLCTTLCSA